MRAIPREVVLFVFWSWSAEEASVASSNPMLTQTNRGNALVSATSRGTGRPDLGPGDGSDFDRDFEKRSANEYNRS